MIHATRLAIDSRYAQIMAVMHESVPANPDLFKPLKEGRINQVERFFRELLWAARALKHARAESQPRNPVGVPRRRPHRGIVTT